MSTFEQPFTGTCRRAMTPRGSISITPAGGFPLMIMGAQRWPEPAHAELCVGPGPKAFSMVAQTAAAYHLTPTMALQDVKPFLSFALRRVT